MPETELTALEQAVLEQLDNTWQSVTELRHQLAQTSRGQIVAALQALRRKAMATYRGPSAWPRRPAGEWASTAKGDTYNWEHHG